MTKTRTSFQARTTLKTVTRTANNTQYTYIHICTLQLQLQTHVYYIQIRRVYIIIENFAYGSVCTGRGTKRNFGDTERGLWVRGRFENTEQKYKRNKTVF